MNRARQLVIFPNAPQGWIGLALASVCWPLNWLLPGVRTVFLFFPLWLGYILLIDAIVFERSGTSILTRSRRYFVLLFFASAPAWWLFEVINWRTANWEYAGAEHFSDLEYFALCTLSFSTVMPAVFETAELARTFRWIERFASGPRLQPTFGVSLTFHITGLVMLWLLLTWPRYCYPFVWVSVFLLLESINIWLGRHNLLENLRHGDWRPVIALSIGALICGFFWELWNYYSFPKWIYHTPGAQFLHIFEMPILGYFGYLPFVWELHALLNFIWPGAPRLRL